MTGVTPLARATVLVAIILVVGCGRDSEAATSSSTLGETTPSPDEGALPTHDETTYEEALFPGTLGGTVDCLWITLRDVPNPLILRAGSTTRQDGNAVLLLDGDGVEVARTGDDVNVTGGFRPDSTSCITGETDGAIVAGPISRGPEPETEPES